MSKKLYFIIITFLFMLQSTVSWGNKWYVNDAWDGNEQYCTTYGDMYNTGNDPGSPLHSVQYLLSQGSVTPGDTVYVDIGTYYESIQISTLSGSASSKIYFIGPQGMYKAKVISQTLSPALFLDGVSNFVFENLSFLNNYNGGEQVAHAVNLKGTSNITLDSCVLQKFEFGDNKENRQGECLVIESTSMSESIDNAVFNCIIENNIESPPDSSTYDFDGIYIIGNPNYVKGTVIRNCNITTSLSSAYGLSAGIVLAGLTDGTNIENNQFLGESGIVFTSSGASNQFQNVMISNNYFYNGLQGGAGTISYCMDFRVQSPSVYSGKIIHNSFYNETKYCLNFNYTTNYNWEVFNNIFYSKLGYCLNITGAYPFKSIDHNIYYREDGGNEVYFNSSGKSLDEWKTTSHSQLQTYGDENSLDENPGCWSVGLPSSLPSSNFNILDGYKQDGLFSPNFPQYDIYYRNRVNPPSIGAYAAFKGLSGLYTVNPNLPASYTNYQDLQSVFEDLAYGFRTDDGPANGYDLYGNTTLELSSGIHIGKYSFQVYADNGFSLNIVSQTRNREDVILYNDGNDHLFSLENIVGVNNISFKHLTFKKPVTVSTEVKLFDFMNCDMQNVTFDSCNFNGSAEGVRFYNSTGKNFRVANCNFSNQRFNAIKAESFTGGNGASPTLELLNNTIKDLGTENFIGVYASLSNYVNVFNSSIINSGNKTNYALKLVDYSSNIKVHHNSIIDHSENSGSTILYAENLSSSTIYNNNFAQFGNGYVYQLDLIDEPTVFIDYNNAFVQDQEDRFAYYEGSLFETFANWKGSNGYFDMNSVSLNPQFANPINNLHLTCNSPVVMKIASNAGGLNTDIDGDSRNYGCAGGMCVNVGFDQYTTVPMAGNYAITQNTNFNGINFNGVYFSISDAVNDLSCRGISDNVTFKIDGGTFNERVYLGDINTAGTGVNPDIITFQALNFNDEPVIAKDLVDIDSSYIVQVRDSVSYGLMFRNIRFQAAAGSDYSRLLHVGYFSTPLRINNCAFEGIHTADTNYYQNLVHLEGMDWPGSLELKNNTFSNGSMAVLALGSGISPGNLTVDNNYFLDQNYRSLVLRGFFLNYFSDNEISLLNIDRDSVIAAELTFLIGGAGKRNVNNNIINMKGNSNKAAMYVAYSQNLRFTNNTLSIDEGLNNIGIYFRDGDNHSLFHNSISLSNSTLSGAVYTWKLQIDSCINNIFSAGQEATNYIYYKDVLSNYAYFDYNDLYANIKITDGTYYGLSLAHMQGWPFSMSNSNSISVDPQFSSATNLNLSENSPDELNNGSLSTLSVVDLDIEGKMRDTLPTLGAYEYSRQLEWVQSTGGSWGDPSSWNNQEGLTPNYVPGAGDEVTIDGDGFDASICSDPSQFIEITVDDHYIVKKIIYEGNCSPAIIETQNGSLSILE